MCQWAGCSKSRAFKTLKLLETHLENIHLNPLLCTQSGCTYNRPFPKKGDLDRHLATIHGIGRLFRCPQRDCTRHVWPFGRKDKFRDHVNRESHGTFKCQFDHCRDHDGGLLTKDEAVNHENLWHSDVDAMECAVGNCEGSHSRFTMDWLIWHLKEVHEVHISRVLLKRMQEQGKTSIISADVSGLAEGYYRRLSHGAELTCLWCQKLRTNHID